MTYTKTLETKTIEEPRLTCDTCGEVVKQGYESNHDILHEQITPSKHGYRYVTIGDLFECVGSKWKRLQKEVPSGWRASIIDEEHGVRSHQTIIFDGEGWYGSVDDRYGDNDREWHHISKIAAQMDEEWRELANQIAIINDLGGKP